MAEAEDAAVSAERLEAALERIARAKPRGAAASDFLGDDEAVDAAELSARLDTLIATVKRALARLNS